MEFIITLICIFVAQFYESSRCLFIITCVQRASLLKGYSHHWKRQKIKLCEIEAMGDDDDNILYANCNFDKINSSTR